MDIRTTVTKNLTEKLGDKLNKLVEIQEELFEPIDIVEVAIKRHSSGHKIIRLYLFLGLIVSSTCLREAISLKKRSKYVNCIEFASSCFVT